MLCGRHASLWAPDAGRVETVSTVDGLDEVLAAASFDVVLLDMNFVSGERSAAKASMPWLVSRPSTRASQWC